MDCVVVRYTLLRTIGIQHVLEESSCILLAIEGSCFQDDRFSAGQSISFSSRI